MPRLMLRARNDDHRSGVKRMNAADIMTRSVIAVSPEAPLAQAVRLMIDRHLSGLPVIDSDGHPVGMLTEGDLLRRVETGTQGGPAGWFASFFMPGYLAGKYVQTHGRRVSEVMTPDVVCVEEATALSEVVDLMQRKRIKRVPVVRGQSVVGIVSRADLLRKVGEGLGAPAVTRDDAAIRQGILDVLEREAWAQRKSISVAVENGVVLLDGCVFDMRERDAAAVVAENIPGVQRVENRLVCIDATSGMLVYDPYDADEAAKTDQVEG
jgi:CBS domain-containing protein